MNRIKAQLRGFSQEGMLYIIEATLGSERLYSLMIDIPIDLRFSNEVTFTIKPSSIMLARDFAVDSSFDNQLRVVVAAIRRGSLLVSVELLCEGVMLEALITQKAYERMRFGVGYTLVALLPSSELVVVE